uniref:Uncharacterized protein n=1 Tax=Ciona intestinalis TaxID=7719 RepID=H2XPV8_CIOIN
MVPRTLLCCFEANNTLGAVAKLSGNKSQMNVSTCKFKNATDNASKVGHQIQYRCWCQCNVFYFRGFNRQGHAML